MLDRFKKVLSVAALALGGFVLAGTTGLLPVSEGTQLFLDGLGSLLATAGVPVYQVGPRLGKTLAILSGMVAAAVGGYWTHHPAWTGVMGEHWFVVLVKVVGMLGIVLGVLGRSALGGGGAPPAPAVAVASQPKP